MTKSAHASRPATASPLLQVVTKEPPKEVTLIETAIRIRGTEYTLAEFGQLYKELRAQGFQANGISKKTLIEATYSIKGVSFTHGELNDLVGKMSELAMAFSKAVTL